MDLPKKRWQWTPRFLKALGPGVVTGAADNDPSGIATYSQAGAQFGYGLLWAIPLLYPLMTAVQEASARIGAVKKKGIAAVTKDHYPKTILYAIISLIFIANTINIGADIGAMAASLELVIPVPFAVGIFLFTAIMLISEIFIPYRNYIKLLKWLVVIMLVYPITMLLVNEPWGEIIQATFIPHIEITPAFLFVLTGIIGTTISPYMFFWQASEEVEDQILSGEISKSSVSPQFIKDMRFDNAFGMLFSQLVTWSIIVVTGTVLHQNGVTNITSAADAARAIEPLVNTFPGSGFLAQLIFAVGIIGLGLLSVPILAGSAAYAIAEAFNWHEGLYKKLREAHGFYGVIILSMLLGLCMNFIGIDPIQALIITAVINAVVSIPLIFLIISISSNKEIMGHHASGLLSKTFLWLTFIVIVGSAVATMATIL